MLGGFRNLFDFDHDGKLDDFEQAAAFATLYALLSQEEENTTPTETASDEAALELAGLDYDALSLMDEEERNAELEDAGLDPDDFDF